MARKPGTIASLISGRAESWLAETTQASVLHLFDEACNLLNQKGRILSLVDFRVGPGPFSLVLVGGRPFTSWMNADSIIEVEAEELMIDEQWIDTSMAAWFDAQPDWHLLREEPSHLTRFLPLIREMLAAHELPETAVTPTLNQKLDEAGAAIKAGLAAADLGVWPKVARQLAGLGSGLTPTGDDYLMGVMFGLWATRPETAARRIAQLIKEEAIPRTATLSAAWLAAAAAGEAGQPWHELVDSLIVGWRQGVINAVRWILATGHSSGADALLGFTAVL